MFNRYYKMVSRDDVGQTYRDLRSIGVSEENIFTCLSFWENEKLFVVQWHGDRNSRKEKQLSNLGFIRD